jgi:hypothetical protein
MLQRVRWVPTLVLAVSVGIVGCGSGGKHKVSGVVKLDGQPLPGAVVTFYPFDGTKGKMASGTTDNDGNFQLTTSKPNDGALPGEYKITVVYAEGIEPPSGVTGMKQAFEGLEKAKKQQKKAPKFVVPTKYGDPGKTDLKQSVPTDGKVTLDLQSKG